MLRLRRAVVSAHLLRFTAASCIVLSGLSLPALATDPPLRIEHPYARPTPPGARTGGAYFTIRNEGTQADRLLRVSSPVAKSAALHSMTMDGNIMRMRSVPSLDIPPGANVVLSPGAFHVMLVDLAHPLVAGEQVPLTLTFEKAGTIDVRADVEAAPPSGQQHAH